MGVLGLSVPAEIFSISSLLGQLTCDCRPSRTPNGLDEQRLVLEESVGVETSTVSKQRYLPIPKRWEKLFNYIENNSVVQDVVVSGGDVYYLNAEYFIHVTEFGRKRCKSVALHNHFNLSNEITRVTRLAAEKLFQHGVTVRNQTVLLKGVNNDYPTMRALIGKLADLNIQPYYVYQGDTVRGAEDLRTPLRDILALEKEIRGTVAGFMTPQFVVDLPGGGEKRLAASFESYDQDTGVSKFVAPGVKGKASIFEYHDPLALA
ncbi:MAG: hypothetical protein Q9207_007454 [Kuettlingeria erythrocarpa]